MKMISRPSPNHDSRDGHVVDMLVLHYTGMMTAQGALEKLCNPNTDRKVSAHYMVDEDGTTYALVPEAMRAWHAGVSSWRGHSNINQRSIGIEIVNPGHEYGYRPFPEAQMVSVAELCKQILSRHAIPARNVVAHSDVAPERKEDPGELFDWKFLAENGIGINPAQRVASAQDIPESSAALPLAQDLSLYGYDCNNLPKTIMAFQRHFRPKLLTGLWDPECALMLNSLLDSTC